MIEKQFLILKKVKMLKQYFVVNIALVKYSVKTIQDSYLTSFYYLVSERLLFNANSAIFQLCHGENKLFFNEMMMRSALY
jgi:hypothetical protein